MRGELKSEERRHRYLNLVLRFILRNAEMAVYMLSVLRLKRERNLWPGLGLMRTRSQSYLYAEGSSGHTMAF